MNLELRIMNILVFAKLDQNTNIVKTRNAIKKAAINHLVKVGKIEKGLEKEWFKTINNKHFDEGYSTPVKSGLIDKIIEIQDVKKDEVIYNTYKILMVNNKIQDVQGLEYNSKIEGFKNLNLIIVKDEYGYYTVSELYSTAKLVECKYKKDIENKLNDLLNALGGVKNLNEKLNELINKTFKNNSFKPVNGEKVEYEFFKLDKENINPEDEKTAQNIDLYIKKDHVLVMTKKVDYSYSYNLFIIKDNKIEFLKAGDKIDLYREFIKDRNYKKELYLENNVCKSVSIKDIKEDIINTYLKEESIQDEKKEIEISLSSDLLQDVNNNNLKASKLIKFLLENNFKSPNTDINKIALKDLSYNSKKVLNAYILDKSIKIKLE